MASCIATSSVAVTPFHVPQACIIGFTSNLIPRLVYRLTVSQNDTLDGYIDNSLSVFRVSDFKSEFRPRNESSGIDMCR